MSLTTAELYAAANAAFAKGDWAESVAAFGGVLQASPSHFRTRFRIADGLLNLGKRDLALDVYKAMGWHFCEAGYPLLAVVATKMILLLEPSHEDLPFALSETYSGQNENVDSRQVVAAVPTLNNEALAGPLKGDVDTIAARAAALAQDLPRALKPEGKYPGLPLLSYLTEEAFVDVLRNLRLCRYSEGDAIVQQGEQGDSFFIIAEGDVAVLRDVAADGQVTLAHLHRGAVFGETVLIADEPRQASVIARGDTDILQLRRSDLVVAAAQHESISDALKAFTRERFLGNLTATLPLFHALERHERHDVMDRFVPITLKADTTIIEEGKTGAGLFLFLSGKASVSKMAGSEQVHLATLRAGDLAGEMSLISAAPTTATVTSREPMEALFLSREDFNAVVAEHPALMQYLAGLSDERVRQNRALLLSRGLLDDDEHVMI